MDDDADGIPAPGAPRRRVPGRLIIRERVVSRIACREALTVEGVVRAAEARPRAGGRALPRALVVIHDHGRGTADTDTDPVRVTVALAIATAWPAPLAALAREVQDRVADRIRRYTGLDPSRVDVAVNRIVSPLASEAASTGRRVS